MGERFFDLLQVSIVGEEVSYERNIGEEVNVETFHPG